MDVGDLRVDPEPQGHRSKVKVTKSKKRNLRSHFTGFGVILELKGHMGQGQKSHGSRSKVT